MIDAEIGDNAIAVIMAGGSGTRFWPLSRSHYPKQFLALAGTERTLLQLTVDRLLPLIPKERILVVTGERFAPLVAEQLPGIRVLVEPQAKNTAPCLGYAAAVVQADYGDKPMICLPADHLIGNPERARLVFASALRYASDQEVLVTIGIPPTSPETGYGYIEEGEKLDSFVSKVACFVEKPDRATAEGYVASGRYSWNSGMFIWRPSVFLATVARCHPALSEGFLAIRSSISGSGEKCSIEEVFSRLPAVSVDVGVMEKADNVVMMHGDSFRWSDVGSWKAWAETLAETLADERGNVAEGHVVFQNSKRCAVKVSSNRVVGLIGLSDVICVETNQAILLCHRDSTQDVRTIVDLLKSQGRDDLL